VGASGLEQVWAIDPVGSGAPRRLMEWAGEAILGVRALEAPQAVEEGPAREGGVAPAGVEPAVVAGGGRVCRCND